MRKVRRVEGVGAALREVNVSTDIISPSPLYLETREAYGPGLFGPWRYDANGIENPHFVLNRQPFRQASILIAGHNFGCGSSRQIAVWCLQDFGMRCVLSSAFADIFSENAFKSGLLVVELSPGEIAAIQDEVEGEVNGAHMAVDLEANEVTTPSGRRIAFTIDPFRREAYLDGLSELDMILAREAEIARFQKQQRDAAPWIVPRENREQPSL